MGKTFRRVVACTAGQFGTQGDKIKQWVEANGGTFVKQITADVTHMIATESAFRKSCPEVRAAKRIKGVKIVPIEWLEDSLLSKSRRPKREGPYLWARKLKAERKEALEKKKASNSGDNMKKRQEVEGYHIYNDGAGQRYSAMLIRPTTISKSKERHVVKMFESDSKPHTYAVFVKYTRIGRVASDFTAPPGSSLEAALRAFRKFFKAKSGIAWDKRGGTKAPPKKTVDGAELPPEEGWFEYTPEKELGAPSLPISAARLDGGTAIDSSIIRLGDTIQEMKSTKDDRSELGNQEVEGRE